MHVVGRLADTSCRLCQEGPLSYLYVLYFLSDAVWQQWCTGFIAAVVSEWKEEQALQNDDVKCSFKSEQRQGVDNAHLSGSDLHSEDSLDSETSCI